MIKLKHKGEFWFTHTIKGNQAVGQVASWVVPFAYRVKELVAKPKGAGTTSTALVDANINDVSVFATAGNRVTLASGSAAAVKASVGTIDGPRRGATGTVLSIDVDQIHTTPATDVTYHVIVEKEGAGPEIPG